MDAAIVTKNSAKLTVPITYLDFFPLDNSVEVTIGPQPPPPKASKKPPAKPNNPVFLLFLFGICFRMAILNKLKPIIMVYVAKTP